MKESEYCPCFINGYGTFYFLTFFCAFCFMKVDVAIIEVGLGGAHDCTNIVLLVNSSETIFCSIL